VAGILRPPIIKNSICAGSVGKIAGQLEPQPPPPGWGGALNRASLDPLGYRENLGKTPHRLCRNRPSFSSRSFILRPTLFLHLVSAIYESVYLKLLILPVLSSGPLASLLLPHSPGQNSLYRFKVGDDTKRESYNPSRYAPQGSVRPPTRRVSFRLCQREPCWQQ